MSLLPREDEIRNEAMAGWIEQHIVPTTRRYLELLRQDERAGV
jgi:hypothetical protein